MTATGIPNAPIVVPCNTPSLIIAISTTVTAGGSQTINLTPGCTYTLTAVNSGSGVDVNGLPLITHTVNLTINGGAATILRDGGAPRFRIFQVTAGAALTLSGLTLTGGHTPDGILASSGTGGHGGAILNDGGTLTVTASNIVGNSTGNGGNCCFNTPDGQGGPGGGIYNDDGAMYITNSTIAGNMGGDGGSAGGGIGGSGGGLGSEGGSVIVTNSTISRNVTGNGNPSASLDAAGFGGGMYVYSGTLTIVNSTLTANATGNGGNALTGLGGAIFGDSAALTVTDSTIASNTVGSFGSAGGIANLSGALLIKNTLMVANAGGSCGFSSVSAGSTHNMADGGCGASFTLRTPGQINLGPLQDNGGPTLTMALRFPSAAIDAGDDASCPATDQRGQPRPHGLHCDIGAFEFQTTLDFLFLPLVRR